VAFFFKGFRSFVTKSLFVRYPLSEEAVRHVRLNQVVPGGREHHRVLVGWRVVARMGADLSKEVMCCDCGLQQRNQILEATEVNGVSSMKLHENNQRFLRAMAEGGKSDLILGLFSTTREFDVNAVDESGESALHKAAKNGHVIVCHVLIKRGSRPNLQNREGKSALDLAREHNHLECVEYLQEPG